MADKILFVDDESDLLRGYKIMLRQDFEVDTAEGGDQGLAAIQSRGPYAVVVSDLRMPDMDGVQFLARVRQQAPQTIRMMLTGYTDIKAAMDAVNEGNVFRFLAKPCERAVLTNAINSALVQHRLVTAEKELLEKTLMGSIKVLTDVLASVSPEAFGRSMRITRCVRHLVSKFHLPGAWCFEAAAMLSQLGCITLDPEVIRASYLGESLSSENQRHFDAHPQVALELLAHIPRLEPVAWMIGQQFVHEISHDAPQTPVLPKEVVIFGAKMLKVAVAFDNLKLRGFSHQEAISYLRHQPKEFDKAVVDALPDIKIEEGSTRLCKVPISALTIGMILQQDVKNRSGLLVIAKGQEVTRPLLIRLGKYSQSQLPDHEILALVPV